jgi:ring hydroxylating enzyme alpha subunit
MAGLFSRADQAVLADLKRNGPPAGRTATEVFDEIRVKAMRGRGYDLSGVSDDELLINGTLHLFPNLVGPVNHGNATLYRIRPDGLDPDRTILDYWALEWPSPGAVVAPVDRKLYPDWSTKDWGTINNQDFATFVEVTRGMKSRGYRGARLNPVQEANIIHHQRMIDRYVGSQATT